jgi:hypothetical protein
MSRTAAPLAQGKTWWRRFGCRNLGYLALAPLLGLASEPLIHARGR